MSVRSGQSVTKVFPTRDYATGAATDADSTPTGTLYVNGTADAATVTVTNITTGLYNAQVTLPTLAFGDVVDLVIAATVSTVAENIVVWSDTKDIAIDAAGCVTLADAVTHGGSSARLQLGASGTSALQIDSDTSAVAITAGNGHAVNLTATGGAGLNVLSTDQNGVVITGTGTYGMYIVGGTIGVQLIGNAAEGLNVAGGGSIDISGVLDLSQFFTVDSGETYASAVAGSVVAEIADNAGGSSLTVQAIVDGVWDEPTASHATAGTTGKALTDAGSAGDPWGTALPGAYSSGTAGFIIGTNLNATITSRMATYTQPTGFLAATFPGGTIASTTNITAGTITTATNVTTVNGLAAGVITAAAIADGAIDAATFANGAITAAVIADGAIDAATFANGAITAAVIADGAIDAATFAASAITSTVIADNAITDAKVASDVTIASVTGAVGSVTGAVGSVTGNVGGNVTGSVGSVVGAVGSVTGAVGSVTGNVGGNVVGSVASVVGSVGSVTGNVGGNVAGSVGSIATGGIAAASFAAGAITATVVADGAIDAATFANGAITAAAIADAAIDAATFATDAISGTAVSAAAVTKIQAGLAVTGAAMTLTTGERDAVAAALLDLVDGIETNYTVREAMRLILSGAAGKTSGASTSTFTIRDVNDTVDRIVATIAGAGNRTALVLDVS